MSRSERNGSQIPVSRPVDIVIPVYGGLEETVAAIESAAQTIDRGHVRLVVINDASPEPEITAWLRDNQEKHQFLLLENPENLGFVGTVNRGMALSDSSDVILLNSDVEVANDWVERLQAAAYNREMVASVTATANNATICSFPAFCRDNELVLGLDLPEIDQCFRNVVPPGTCVEIPSAVGCCMYIRRDALNELGLFDVEAFGRGYGEENDWSQRAIKQGWVNLHSLDVFVYHKGGVSFAAESDPRKQANLEIVNRRHPNYASDVQSFIAEDPAATWRIRVLIQLLGELDKPKSLAISHGLGGGVKSHILELVREVREVQFLHLEPQGGDVVRLEFLPGEPGGPYINFRIPQDYSVLLEVLKGCGVGHVHFHHTMRLPTRLWGAGDDLDCPVDYTLHDYWVLNGNPTQTDETGCYVGSGSDADERCQRAYPLPKGVTPQRWRENQLPLMEKARYLICPSIDTMRRISSADEFRKLKQWVATPHLDHADVAEDVRSKREKSGPLKVVALGALSREKGADLLEAAAIALKDEAIEFHLLGYAYRELDSAVITHGAYPEQECEARLLALEPDVVWYTARWPETYSYTLSSALRTGLPVVAPGIGAFPERLAGRKATVVVDDFEDPGFWPEFWRKVVQNNAGELLASRAPEISIDKVDTGFYQTAYLKALSVRKGHLELSDESLIDLLKRTHHDDEIRGRRMYLLSILVRLRQAKGLSWCVRLIPFRWQRAVKRFLSREPMHDLK